MMYVHNNVKQRHFKTQITMSNQTQNKLFHYIISNTEIDDIQSRFIAYKLELNQVGSWSKWRALTSSSRPSWVSLGYAPP